VLAPVKDVPLSLWPSAILDERCARRHRNVQAGAESSVASRTEEQKGSKKLVKDIREVPASSNAAHVCRAPFGSPEDRRPEDASVA
jgi:hypothetical protein